MGLGRPPLPAGTLEAAVERFQFAGGFLTAQGWAYNASRPIVAG